MKVSNYLPNESDKESKEIQFQAINIYYWYNIYIWYVSILIYVQTKFISANIHFKYIKYSFMFGRQQWKESTFLFTNIQY